MRNLKIIDISQLIDATTPAYYGDTPFSLRWIYDKEIKTSEIKVTPHVGTHVDAPLHFSGSKDGVGELPIEMFVGWCLVVPGEYAANPVLLSAWPCFAEHKKYGKILFNFEDKSQGISFETAEFLIKEQFHLLGTTNPSIDDEESKNFPIHRLALSRGVCALENLVLKDVEPGLYFLNAAPLRWVKAEASPVRAYLIQQEKNC